MRGTGAHLTYSTSGSLLTGLYNSWIPYASLLAGAIFARCCSRWPRESWYEGGKNGGISLRGEAALVILITYPGKVVG